jgi:hypothetical protein
LTINGFTIADWCSPIGKSCIGHHQSVNSQSVN